VTAALARKMEIRRVRAPTSDLKVRGLKMETVPAEMSLLARDGMLDLFPVGGEVELFAVRILVAPHALGLDGVGAAVEDQTVLRGHGLVLHHAEHLIPAAGAVTDFAGDAFGLELGRFSGERRVALETARIVRRLVHAHGLGGLCSFGSAQGGEGLGMFGGLPNNILLSLFFGLMANLAFRGADVGEFLADGRDGQNEKSQS